MSEQYCLVLCTCPDKEDIAIQLANKVVSARIAACVNILPGITSIYGWEDRVNTDTESLLLIKTQTAKFPQIQKMIQQHHPYELPEMIAVPIKHGSTEYLDWIDKWLNFQVE